MLTTDSQTSLVRRAFGWIATVAAIALWPVAPAAQLPPGQASQRQPPALTQQAEITPYGIVVRYPADWSFSGEGGVWRLLNLPADRVAAADPSTFDQLGQIFISVERRRDHADAVARLQSLRGGANVRATFLTIGGWPAIQQRVVVDREQPGGEFEEQQPPASAQEEFKLPPQRPRLTPARILRVTTAIAADNLLVRLEGRMPPESPPALEATVRAIGQSATFRTRGEPGQVKRELGRVQRTPPSRPIRPPVSRVRTIQPMRLGTRALPLSARSGAAAPGAGTPPPPGSLQMAGLAQRVVQGGIASETEIAVSANGQNIVVGQQFRFATSNDGGQTFPFTGLFPNTTSGDPSLAFGRSGTFYAASISLVAGATPGSTIGTTTFNVSTNNGQTFTFRAAAYTCPATGPNVCPARLPDQEHIAADRFNASAGGGDQVYSTWRHLNGNYGIVCSNDGGQNWTAGVFSPGDVPRIAVGQDGFVYVVYQNNNDIEINRYSSCNAGLVVQPGWPRVVATVGPNWAGGSPCTMPGLDRCNNGNNLSSFTVAVDDTNANHIYVAYAQSTSAANENVIVRHSTDSGFTWPAAASVTVNGGGNGRRFMPWLCSAAGVAYVSWFDRRAATAANNSLTDFYGGSASVNGSGNLVAGPDRRINATGTGDNQCFGGQVAVGNAGSWPGGSRATTDSENCVQQPELAGQCQRPTTPPSGSFNSCDFNQTTCPAGESCVLWGGGTPKYGDYNGNACAAGRVYTVWPSGTLQPPAAIAAAGRIDLYFASLVVAASQIQIPGPVRFPDTCVGASNTMTANVCNTGTRDLHVDPITSSDPQFSVFPPSSGYPVTIAPGSCFPFQVRFAPSSAGNKAATLTVPSDDSVTPSATILVSGAATQTGITTAIADSGDFGNVSANAFRDQPLVLTNPGGCPLTVSNITSSAPDFQTAQVVSYPFVIAPGASVAIPIRFQPTSFGPKSGTLTIASSDPLTPARQIRVTGNGGAPLITTSVVDTGNFGPVCVGSTADLNVTVNNGGTSPLLVSSITSSSPEFQTPQVLAFPLVIAPGTSFDVPIRFAPTTSGAKTATITINSNDPTTSNKVVTFTAETPDLELCHPPSFTSVGLSIGPTFGSSRMGDYTFTGHGRHLVPFGEKHTFGLQTQGEYFYYHGRHEGQFDVGVMNRWKRVQFGVFGDFKYVDFGRFKDGGVLGQASAVLDLLFNSVKVNIFGSRGFKDVALLSRDTTLTFVTPSAAVASDVEHVARATSTLGAGLQFGVGPNTEIDGHVMWLRRERPTPLSDGVGAMGRVTHHTSNRFALFGEVTLNESYLGPTNSGRVVFGFIFGRWTRPSDLANKHTPLGTDVPRVHFDLQTRPR